MSERGIRTLGSTCRVGLTNLACKWTILIRPVSTIGVRATFHRSLIQPQALLLAVAFAARKLQVRTLGSLLSYDAKEKLLRTVSQRREIFAERMSRFPAPYCVKGYETILSSKKKTAVCAGGNYPGGSGNISLNGCAKHYHL